MIRFGYAVASLGLVVIICGFIIDSLTGFRMPDNFQKCCTIAAYTLWGAGVVIAIVGGAL